jgi:hypothetical protein
VRVQNHANQAEFSRIQLPILAAKIGRHVASPRV